MQNVPTYRMHLTENAMLTAPECDVPIVRIMLEPLAGALLRPFIPGQFVRIGIPGKPEAAPAYFAMASAPTDSRGYEFVVKCGSPLTDHLKDLRIGSSLEVEGPMGKGFDLSAFEGSDVILMGVGTGIAPLRSVWRWLIDHREKFGSIKIYAGFLTSMHLLLTDEMAGLGEHHIDVSVSLATGHEGWSGPIGYVQHALENDAPDGSNAVVCLAGMSAMVDACKESLQSLGFNESRILLNY